MQIVDALVVTLGLDASKFRSGQKSASEDLKKTTENANTAAKSIESSGKNAAQFFGKLRNEAIGLFAVFTAGRGIKDFVRDITTGDAATGRMAKNLGLATEELATWQNAAERSGGTAAGITGSMQSLSSQITKFRVTGQGGEDFIPWLDRVHVSLIKTNGDYKTMAELYSDINKSSQWQGLSPQQKTEFGAHLGMDQGTINTLAQSPAWISKTAAEAKARGLPSADDVRRAQELQNNVKNLQDSLTGLGRTLLNDVSEPLTKVMDQFDHFLQKPETKEAIAQFTDKVKAFGDYLLALDWTAIGAGVEEFLAKINSVAQALGGWTNLAEVFFGVWALAKFAPLIGAFGSILGLVGGITTGIRGLIALAMAPEFLAAAAAIAALMPSSGAGKDELDKETALKEQNRKDHPENVLGESGPARSDPFKEWWSHNAPSWAPGSASKTTAEQRDRSKRAIDYFMSQGWTAEQAAGLVGNIQQESSFDEKAGAGTAHQGLAQWSKERQADIEKRFGKPLMSMSYDEQLRAMQWELTEGKYKNVGDKLRQQTSEKGSAALIEGSYEIPGNDNYEIPRRAANASARLAEYRGGVGIGASASAARSSGGSISTNTSSQEVNVNGPITIHAKDGDAKGIATGLQSALTNMQFSAQMNRGLA